MIDKAVIQKIKNEVKIVELAESLGLEPKKIGYNYFVKCPLHDDKNESLSINPLKNLWQCFGCGAGGDSISLYMKVKNKSFTETIADLSAL